MKRILIFIGLKVAEIGGVIFVPYWLGRLLSFAIDKISLGEVKIECVGFFKYWSLGFVIFIAILFVLFSIGFISYWGWLILREYFKWNWKKAGKIVNH